MASHHFTTSAPTWPLHAIVMDDDFNGDFEGFDEDDDEDFFDCMMGPDGQCGKAGSEECEFDCPTMRAWRRGDIA